VFHSADAHGVNFTAAEEVLSNQMVAYWTNFAASKSASPNGDPSNNGANSLFSTLPVNVLWPEFDTNTWKHLHLATPIKQASHLFQSNCDFWDTLGYAF
jgi:hypothetical protein